MKRMAVLLILLSIIFYNYSKIEEAFFQMKLNQNKLNYDIDYYFDLNNDGVDEKIKLEKNNDDNNIIIVDLYINEKLTETYTDEKYISAYICDFNKMDNHKEIYFTLGNNRENSKTNIFIYYDGNETDNFILDGTIVHNDDKSGLIKIAYGNIKNSLNFTDYGKVLDENSIRVNYIYKRVLNFGVIDIKEKEVKVVGISKEIEYIAENEINVYETNIGDSDAYILSKGDKVKLVSLYNYGDTKSIKIVNEEGRYGWIKIKNKQLFHKI